jgi:hypothetical protein
MNRVCIDARAGFSTALLSPALKAPLTIGKSEGPDVDNFPPRFNVIERFL